MGPSSHVIANLDGWLESGFISDEQRSAFEQIISGAVYDAYVAGLADAPSSIEYDKAYDDGWEDGNDSGRADVNAAYDDGYEDGYEAGAGQRDSGE